MCTYLQAWDCQGYGAASNGSDALATLRSAAGHGTAFDLAIIDRVMPGMDGEALCREIKAEPVLKDTQLVMLATRGQRGDGAQAKEIGCAAYLTKPIRQSQMLDCLTSVLGDAATQGADVQDRKLVTRHTIAEERKCSARILLAEDNAINQKVAMRMLEKLGYRADTAANGKEAVKALEAAPYDLVLMDCHMPEMDGFEATKLIRDPQSAIRNHKVPIIAMTANAMKGDREKCLEAGMDDYVAKPVKSENLAAAIERCLNAAAERDDTCAPVLDEPSRSTPAAPVDLARLRMMAAGDGDDARELIEMYLKDTDERIARLHGLIEAQDAEEMTLEAHTLKGASATLGVGRMSEVALQLETFGLTGSFDEAPALVEALEAEFENVRTYLADHSK